MRSGNPASSSSGVSGGAVRRTRPCRSASFETATTKPWSTSPKERSSDFRPRDGRSRESTHGRTEERGPATASLSGFARARLTRSGTSGRSRSGASPEPPSAIRTRRRGARDAGSRARSRGSSGSVVALESEEKMEDWVRQGRFTPAEVAAIRAEGERVLAASPFPTGWEDWRPDPSWRVPKLPSDWSWT